MTSKIGLREWTLLFATACVAASLVLSARYVLFNGGHASSFEVPLGVIAPLLVAWGTGVRMDRTQAKWLLFGAIVVSVVLLGMLVVLPGGAPLVRFLLVGSAVIIIVGAILKLLRRL